MIIDENKYGDLHKFIMSPNQSRPWTEMFESTRFSVPENQDIWRERLETNILYYFINYFIIFIIFIFVGFIIDKFMVLLFLGLCFIIMHSSFRKRSIKSKFNRYMTHASDEKPQKFRSGLTPNMRFQFNVDIYERKMY